MTWRVMYRKKISHWRETVPCYHHTRFGGFPLLVSYSLRHDHANPSRLPSPLWIPKSLVMYKANRTVNPSAICSCQFVPSQQLVTIQTGNPPGHRSETATSSMISKAPEKKGTQIKQTKGQSSSFCWEVWGTNKSSSTKVSLAERP